MRNVVPISLTDRTEEDPSYGFQLSDELAETLRFPRDGFEGFMDRICILLEIKRRLDRVKNWKEPFSVEGARATIRYKFTHSLEMLIEHDGRPEIVLMTPHGYDSVFLHFLYEHFSTFGDGKFPKVWMRKFYKDVCAWLESIGNRWESGEMILILGGNGTVFLQSKNKAVTYSPAPSDTPTGAA